MRGANAHITDISKINHAIYDISYADVIKLINTPLHHDTIAYFKLAMDIILNVELAMSLTYDRKPKIGRKTLRAWSKRHTHLPWKLMRWVEIGEKAKDFHVWLDDFKNDLNALINYGMNVSEDINEDAVIVQIDMDLPDDVPMYIYVNHSKKLIGNHRKYFTRKGWVCFKKYPTVSKCEHAFNILMREWGYRPVDSRVFDKEQ